jgi:hypothetical protein
MSCCKKSGAGKTETLPKEKMTTTDVFAMTQHIVARLLQFAHLNNKTFPAELTPLALANLLHSLLEENGKLKEKTQSPAALPVREEFVLKFGPNQAYELHLPGKQSVTAALQADPQQKFDFSNMDAR